MLDLHIHAAASDPFKNNNFNEHGKYRVKRVVGIGFQNRHLNKLWSKNNGPLHFKKEKKKKRELQIEASIKNQNQINSIHPESYRGNLIQPTMN